MAVSYMDKPKLTAMNEKDKLYKTIRYIITGCCTLFIVYIVIALCIFLLTKYTIL